MTSKERVQIRFPSRDGGVEKMWARPRGETTFEIDNIPAFAFGVSLGDIVEAFRDDHGVWWALRVVERGPYATIRVALDARRPRALRLSRLLQSLGCGFEGMRSSWIAIATPNEQAATLVANLAGAGYVPEYANPPRAAVELPHPKAATEPIVQEDVEPHLRAILHPEPAWPDAEDEVEVTASGRSSDRPELLPAKQMSETTWQLCSTPFFALGHALGDLVEVDAALVVRRTIRRSGRAAIMVHVADAIRIAELLEALRALDILVERRSKTSGTMGISCPAVAVSEVRAQLDSRPFLTYALLG